MEFLRYILLFFVVCVLSGCRTKYVPVPEYHTDTLLITQHARDSIWLHDSIMVAERGDTVRIEKWHTKYIERLRTDTVYQSRTDSVGVPYPVEVEVAKPLTAWQKVRIHLGEMMIGFVLAALIWGGVWLWSRNKTII